MASIRPDDIRLWKQAFGPTADVVKDNALTAALLVAKRHGDWRPFTDDDWKQSLIEFGFFAAIKDLVRNNLAILLLPLEPDGQARYSLTDHAIILCYIRSPERELTRP